MNKLLKFGDIFSFDFKFSSFGSSKFGTVVGGLLSLLLLIIGIVVLVLFGKDFYQRTSPYVTSQKEVPDSFNFLNLTADNFTIAFRFETYEGILFQLDGFSIVGYYYNMTKLKANLVIEDCDSLNINNALYSRELKFQKGWKCVNFNKTIPDDPVTPIGGAWNSEIYYFYLDFMIDMKYSEILKSYGIMASIMVPDYYFSPDNYDSPLNTRYKNVYLNLDKSVRKYLSVYFESPSCFDDIGLIFEQFRNFTVLSYADITLDMILDNQIDNNLILSTVSFYYNSQFDKYNRNYVKLQDVLANVGGLMQVLYYVFFILIIPYQDYKMNSKFVNSFFSFDVEQEKELSNPASNLKLVSHKQAMTKLKNRYLSLKYMIPKVMFAPQKTVEEIEEKIEIEIKSSTQRNKTPKTMNFDIGKIQSPFNYSNTEEASMSPKSFCVNHHKLNLSSINSLEDKKDKANPVDSIFDFKVPVCGNDAPDSDNQNKESKLTSPDQSLIVKETKDNEVRFLDSPISLKKMTAKKFENFFSNHLKYMAQKKKGGFNLNITDELIEEMKNYKVKYSKIQKNGKLQEGFNPSFIGHLKLMICPNKMLDKVYTISNKLITEKLDITNYLKLIHDMSKLKRILLNYYQNLSLNFQIKPNIHSEDDVVLNSSPEDLDRHMIETIGYYMSLDRNEQMSSTDYIILQDLESPLKNLILDKCPDLKFFYTKLS